MRILTVGALYIAQMSTWKKKQTVTVSSPNFEGAHRSAAYVSL